MPGFLKLIPSTLGYELINHTSKSKPPQDRDKILIFNYSMRHPLPAQPLRDEAHTKRGQHATDGEDGHRQGPEGGEGF